MQSGDVTRRDSAAPAAERRPAPGRAVQEAASRRVPLRPRVDRAWGCAWIVRLDEIVLSLSCVNFDVN